MSVVDVCIYLKCIFKKAFVAKEKKKTCLIKAVTLFSLTLYKLSHDAL